MRCELSGILRFRVCVTIAVVGVLLCIVSAVATQPAASAQSTGATFYITWSASCQPPPPAAVAALEYAAGLWGTWLSSTVPIEVSACWIPSPYGGNALGTGRPARYVSNVPGAPLMSTYYPIALADALSGHDLNPSGADIMLEFDSDEDWSYITATTHLNAAAANYDFVTVALHELAHGLGFIGNMVEEYNVGFCGSLSSYYCPTPYDWFAVDSAGVPLLSYLPDDPYALAERLKSDANFGGPNTVATNGGTAAKLYTPPIWGTSSFSHLDRLMFQSTSNSLMTPNYAGARRHPGPVTLAMMQDMGWLRADGVPNVVTAGPWVVGAGQAVTFTGDLIWSGYTGQPITYTWTATGQAATIHPDLATTDAVVFTWSVPGEKRITLTATDGAASAYATRRTFVYDVMANGPTQGKTNYAYIFNAALVSGTLGFPITYTWEAVDNAPIVHANLYQANDSAAFTWTMPGTKTITVTVAILGGVARDVHSIRIEGLVLDKHVFLPLVLR